MKIPMVFTPPRHSWANVRHTAAQCVSGNAWRTALRRRPDALGRGGPGLLTGSNSAMEHITIAIGK